MFHVISIFSGAGGMDLGFCGGFRYLDNYYRKLKFKTMLMVERDKEACDTLKNNKWFKDADIKNADITTMDKKQYSCDVLIGGFPCVTFSMVGNRNGVNDDINGKLYLSFVDYITFYKPKVFVAENVKGILSSNKGRDKEIILKSFEDLGYVVSVYLVNFADYGVPQLRERVLFIGVCNDIKEQFIPPTKITTKHTTSREALSSISDNIANNEIGIVSDNVKKKLEHIPEGGNFKDLPVHLSVKGMMSNIYRKLDRNKPSTTVIASGGGGTYGYHYEEHRPLTNRERARLQSFPDDFVFYGTGKSVRRQIGNAVPPVGIFWFAQAIEALLCKIDMNTKKIK